MTSKDVDNNPIVVSISCITYNHAPFIRQCLDGFLMQQTNFAFEVLIHDDASTDGTTEIIKEYEARYPDVIKPIYEEENQWVKGRRGSAVFNFPRARGKYIALCEGDDYWTDPLKLQKQVDFLEKNPDYVMCSHRFYQLNQSTGDITDDWYGMLLNNVHYNSDTIISFKEWYTQPVTILFRKSSLDLTKFKLYKQTRDLVLVYHILQSGSGVMLNESMAVYRKHKGGIWTGISYDKQITMDIKTCIFIYEVERDSNAAMMLCNRLSLFGHRLGLKYIIKNMWLLLKSYRIICREMGFGEAFTLCLNNVTGLLIK